MNTVTGQPTGSDDSLFFVEPNIGFVGDTEKLETLTADQYTKALAAADQLPTMNPQDLWLHITTRIESYNPRSHANRVLKPNQRDAISRLFEDIMDGGVEYLASDSGYGIVSPTGSGKTAIAANVLQTLELPGAHFVPRLRILSQTVGSNGKNGKEVSGFGRFMPDVRTGQYSSRGKRLKEEGVNVMTYHSLASALLNGALGETFLPQVAVCDEMHHVAEGRWGELVRAVGRGRLLLGFTATHVDKLVETFPRIPYKLETKEAIKQEILSDLVCYTYLGTTPINCRISDKTSDYNKSELLGRLLDCEENQLAAQICAEEVARGGKGVVSCVPGNGCIHAKTLADILCNTAIVDKDGVSRNIRASHISSDMTKTEQDSITKAYEEGELDVITFVDMMVEGWDSPETDFAVMLRPTASEVFARQRLGRILRKVKNKVARVHEILYTNVSRPQYTHQDMFGISAVQQGYSIAKEAVLDRRHLPNVRPFITAAEVRKTNPALADRLALVSNVPKDELEIITGIKDAPKLWVHESSLLERSGISAFRLQQLIKSEGILPKTDDRTGGRTYPPRIEQIVAAKLDLPVATDQVAFSRILAAFRKHNPKITNEEIRAVLKADEIIGQVMLKPSGSIDMMYPKEALHAMHAPSAQSVRPETEKIKTLDLGHSALLPKALERLDAVLLTSKDFARLQQSNPQEYKRISNEFLKIRRLCDSKRRNGSALNRGNIVASYLEEQNIKLNPAIIAAANAFDIPVGLLVYIATDLISEELQAAVREANRRK